MIALIKLNPITAAKHFLEKLAIMQKNLVIGLSRAAADDAKTFPGVSELLFLRLTGAVWSTSDFRHPVIAPALLLMAQYLGQCRIRNVADLASGLFLCSLVLEVRLARTARSDADQHSLRHSRNGSYLKPSTFFEPVWSSSRALPEAQ